MYLCAFVQLFFKDMFLEVVIIDQIYRCVCWVGDASCHMNSEDSSLDGQYNNKRKISFLNLRDKTLSTL